MPILSPSTKVDNRKTAFGVHTTVAASDSIDTGLTKVECLVVAFNDDPVDGAMWATGVVPASGGTVTIKTWKNTDADATLIAATTFSKKVSWIAIGY